MTASHAPGRACAARTVGPIARHFLDSRAEGRVIAAFRSVFYIGAGAQMICIGTGAVEDGPLTLVASAPATLDWRDLGLRPGLRAAISATAIRVGGDLRIPLGDATDWSPGPIAAAPDPAAAARGLAALRAAFAGQVPEGGLGRFIAPGYRPAPHHRECLAAEAPITEARQWLGDVFAQARGAGAPGRPEWAETWDRAVPGLPRDLLAGRCQEVPGQARDRAGVGGHGTSLAWVDRLVGLGPGLTPSGDDFLGGLMIALHRLGRAGDARLPWRRVKGGAEAINPISLALLQAASQGLGSASIHRALEAILRGDAAAVRESMPGIARIGHSSGWDAMAGIVATLDCWQIAAREPLLDRNSLDSGALDARKRFT